MNSIPKITVLMTVYNAAAYVAEAIESVLYQTFTNFEFVIVNDGSTDETESIISGYTDSRIVLLKQENKGIAAALNYGLAHARSEWIARFDADDICYPCRLQLQYEFINSNQDCIIVGSAADYIDMEGQFIFTYLPPATTTEEIYSIKNKICPFIHSSVLYRKDAVLKAGGYDLHSHGFEDHFLWLKLLEYGKAANLSQSLMKVRLNPQSFTMDEKWRPRKFRKLKSKVLQTESISIHDGKEFTNLLQTQNSKDLKRAAYYALIGKKYLWNNYQPIQARRNFYYSWQLQPTWSVGLLWLLSFLPETFIAALYRAMKRNELTVIVKSEKL